MEDEEEKKKNELGKGVECCGKLFWAQYEHYTQDLTCDYLYNTYTRLGPSLSCHRTGRGSWGYLSLNMYKQLIIDGGGKNIFL